MKDPIPAARSYHIDENIVAEADDWLDDQNGATRTAFLDTIRGLDIRRIQRFPAPKARAGRGGVPFGHELRVLRSYVSGGNSLFEPSGLWRLYHRFASDEDRLMFRAFILVEPLSEAEWSRLLGEGVQATWHQHKFLRRAGSGWSSRFRVCPVGSVVLLGDPDVPKLLRRVVIGQDSYSMASFMSRQKLGRFKRYLDVGPGSGVVLLNVAPHAEESLGFDINPRAVAISRLNAELNRTPNCTVHEVDALTTAGRQGRFDLITWNMPFVFLPEECRGTHLDAFGGHLGMELPLKFIRALPELLDVSGKSYLGGSAPIDRDGENLLERELRPLARELGFDIVNHVIQPYWHDLYREFHEAHGIFKNEACFLEITRGSGRFRRVGPPLTARVAGVGRQMAYRVWR